jgi:hypothetical protein
MHGPTAATLRRGASIWEGRGGGVHMHAALADMVWWYDVHVCCGLSSIHVGES